MEANKMPYKNGPFLELGIPDEENGKLNRKYISIQVLLDRIWEEYMLELLTDEYIRGLLREIGFDGTTIFHMLEQLQLGRTEFERNDYNEESCT